MQKRRLLFCFLAVLSITTEAQEKLKADKELPILAWFSIPPSETSLARYQEMREAGITHQFTGFPDAASLQKALDVAQQAGIKIVASCPELKTDPEGTVKRFKNHPALVGYHLGDEPNIQAIPGMGAWAKRVLAADPKHFVYLNLFPNFATDEQLGTKDYGEYVDAYIKDVPVQFLSFDYYPVFKDHLATSWYANLEIIALKSRQANKPFWAFVLTTNFDDGHVTPQTLAAMRLQAYSDLAYGAQGIQYFTYWSATSVDAPSGEDQRGAPITATGKRSVVYDRARELSQELQRWAPAFVGAKVISVRHTGKGAIPSGTVRLTSLPDPVKVLETNGAPALVSVLENGDWRYLLLINKDHQNAMPYVFYSDGAVSHILKDGTIVPASAYEPAQELDPGDAVLFRLPKAER